MKDPESHPLNSTKNNPNVVFRGWLKKDELDESLKDSHIAYALQNKSPQGWPTSLSSMSYGLPMINSLKVKVGIPLSKTE